MTVRPMNVDDLKMVLGWAADEGWNPGLDDAAAFHAADPTGFLLKEVNGKPVAAICVVNHDPDFAFLGLYLCKRAFRGQGHGMEIWKAGIAHAGSRSIGLDGVPDQQENYARSGFVKYGSTVRYEGQILAKPDDRIQLASSKHMHTLVSQDRAMCGIDRRAFSMGWFSQTPNRRTLVLMDGKEITGFATFRRCPVGSKIGPLRATSKTDALALLAANPFIRSDQACFADVQDQASPLAILLKIHGFEPVFETARMFRGAPPKTDPSPFQAIASMELG